eukprot:3672984-Karenia_brevis.AAC.1
MQLSQRASVHCNGLDVISFNAAISSRVKPMWWVRCDQLQCSYLSVRGLIAMDLTCSASVQPFLRESSSRV